MAELEPVDESWSSALAIVAHPDDLEYGTAAAIARWTAQGKRVVYTLATSGEAGIDGLAPEDAGPLREQEQRASAAVVGVDVACAPRTLGPTSSASAMTGRAARVPNTMRPREVRRRRGVP